MHSKSLKAHTKEGNVLKSFYVMAESLQKLNPDKKPHLYSSNNQWEAIT